MGVGCYCIYRILFMKLYYRHKYAHTRNDYTERFPGLFLDSYGIVTSLFFNMTTKNMSLDEVHIIIWYTKNIVLTQTLLMCGR